MSQQLLSIAIRYEQDVVLARHRAREIAALLGFDTREQVAIATAVSEIARNAFQYAGGGKVGFSLDENRDAQLLRVRVSDSGPGIPDVQQALDGRAPAGRSGMGLVGARRLMDEFAIDSVPHRGTTVTFGKRFPRRARLVSAEEAARIRRALSGQTPRDPYEELQRQNQELLAALEELERRQAELAQLNKELEDTNRGVVALYAELDERADYLKRASELKSQFLSNMTHEFRTPLNSILSLSSMLLERLDGDLTSEQERQVEYIRNAANDLSELVNDLLDLAKVEAGKVAIRPSEFDIRDLFGALRGMLRPLLAHNSSVSLQFDEPAGLPALHTDESKISQILRNLISNALKFTEQGEVRVAARLEPDGKVAFLVSDTGIGIAPANQARIFEEFSQVEGPHQAGKKGTGLGLPLSRKLAELLGGTLTVQSEPGRGSTFILSVPSVHQGAAEMSVAPEPAWELDPTRQPVLVVEDNRETVLIYEKFLRGTGYQILAARTISGARQLLQRFRPAAVVLDILLNHENAWDFLGELKHNKATCDIPVLVVTLVANEAKACALGADVFHTKPIERQWLVDQLNRLVRPQRRDEVLIIDDEEISRYVLAGLLSETRFSVIEAHNGRQALDVARARRPSAIFLDLMMPDLNGYEFLEKLQADPELKRIPVIVHTSKALSDNERHQLAACTAAVIQKTHGDRDASLQRIREALVSATQPTLHTPPHGAA